MSEKEYSVIIFYNSYGEILLQKKDLRYPPHPGCWAFFGGGIEEGETSYQAIVREVDEELGIELKNAELFQECSIGGVGQLSVYIAPFDYQLSDLSLGEGCGFAFFSADEIKSINLSNQQIITDFFAKKPYN